MHIEHDIAVGCNSYGGLCNVGNTVPICARDVINASWVYFVFEISYLYLAEHSVAC